MTNPKIFQYTALTIIAVAGIILGYFFYMLYYPFKTVELAEPIKVLTPVVERGTNVTLQLDVVKHANYQAESVKYIVCEDGNLVTLAPNITNIPTGENQFTVSFPIPRNTSLETCHLVFNNTYIISPIRSITQEWRTEDFEVVE